ncbi:MAG: electron transport complex subunit RsxD [Gammaproteobacteria bacterium]|nr:MAG: electron transport complex subunit RsxD [Gammaproteobacteria bacterium]
MEFKTPTSPHIHSGASVSRVMLLVVAAAIPGIAVYVGFFGWGVVINIMLALITALACEAGMLLIRKRPVLPFLADGSAVVTAILLALALPAIAPWWIVVIGAAFAIIIAKQLYGGLGYNPFNPAMAGYVMLLVSFPIEMTRWQAPLSQTDLAPGFFDSWNIIFSGLSDKITDAISMATPLDTLKTELRLDQNIDQIITGNPLFSNLAGLGWEWINIAFLVGGLFLLYKRIISWHIPVAMLATIALLSGMFYIIDPNQFSSPTIHLLSGATMLGAFFIATDPVSAATSNPGRIVYGIGIGVFTYVIRTWGGYPDAIAFSVLLMNMVAPTIDYYIKPRVFGHGQKK